MSRITPPKKPKPREKRQVRRVNWKGLAIVGGALVLCVGLSFPIKSWNAEKIRSSAMAQAKASQEKGDVELAIRHLDRYLVDQPDDARVLQARADLVVNSPRSGDQLLDAANTLDRLIRLDPEGTEGSPEEKKGKNRDTTKLRLAEIYVRYSDFIKDQFRIFGEIGADQDSERKMYRYNAAAGIAAQLLDLPTADDDEATKRRKAGRKEKPHDGDAHRALAMAMEGQDSELRARTVSASKNDDSSMRAIQLAVENYRAALRSNPRDAVASERLANLYLARLKDPASAEEVLENLLKADGKSVAVRLVRHEFFARAKRDDRAKAELDAAMALAPDVIQIRLQAAKFALGHRDTAEARRQLDAIPGEKQNDLGVKVLRGYLEFAEQHPDQAIDQWRRGLTLVGGGDQGLTWQLAFNLIQLGRLGEADPLVKQYNRLAKGDKSRLGQFLEAIYELAAGHVNEATKVLEKIKDAVPPYLKADAYLNLARCYEQKGEDTNALIAFRNAATAAPSSPGPRLEIARMIQKRHPEEAISELDRAISDSPDDPNLLIQMLRLRIVRQQALPPEKRQWAEINDLFARAEVLAPNNWILRNLKADYLAASGKLADAVDMLGAAARGADRNRAEAWIGWAQGLERSGRREEAIKALDQGALPENAGDRARLRIAKARLLAQSGKGQAAREVLGQGLGNVPGSELADLAQAKGELLRQLGDRDGCRAAYVEWARLAPQSPKPGLALFDLALIDNDEQAAKLGLEALRAIGGDSQPYGMAARAFSLLRADPGHPGPPPADRLEQAAWLVDALREEAPSLRIGYLLKGMIQEYRGNLNDALSSYKSACKDDPISFALPRLIETYMKLKRYDDLDRLKREVEQEAMARQLPGIPAEFDRIAALVALKLGDKDRADFFAAKMVEGRPDSVQGRAAYARLLDSNGKPEEAVKTLQALADERKNDPVAWLTLIAFEAIRKPAAEVSRTIQKARKEYKGDRPELFLAQCYWLGKDLANAKTAYQKATDLRPTDLVTLRSLVEFYVTTNQYDPVDPVLRKVLKVDPTASWAARFLADRLSAKSDPATWAEAWSLVAPGSPASGETPEDRLMRATVLARSPENGRRSEAIPAFVGLANDLPISSPVAVDTRIRLSQAMIDSNRFAEAWEYVRPIADNPNRVNANALVIAVEALARSGRPDEAERRLDRLAQADPKSPQVALSRAWVLTGRGLKDQASSTVEEAYAGSKDAPNAEAIALAAGEFLLKVNDLGAAQRLGEVVAERWPRDAWFLARVQLARKDYDRTFASCRAAYEAGSYLEALRYAVAAAIPRRNDPSFLKQVVDLGEQVRSKAPKNFNILVFLATLRHVQGRYEDEMALYREALELSPNHVEFLNNMAWTLCEGLGKPDEALKQIDEAIRREGIAPQYLDTRGVILSRQGKFPEAIANLEQSAKGDPSPTTYFHLARVYLMANKPSESQRCRDLALKSKFDPESLDPTDRSDLEKVMGTR